MMRSFLASSAWIMPPNARPIIRRRRRPDFIVSPRVPWVRRSLPWRGPRLPGPSPAVTQRRRSETGPRAAGPALGWTAVALQYGAPPVATGNLDADGRRRGRRWSILSGGDRNHGAGRHALRKMRSEWRRLVGYRACGGPHAQ